VCFVFLSLKLLAFCGDIKTYIKLAEVDDDYATTTTTTTTMLAKKKTTTFDVLSYPAAVVCNVPSKQRGHAVHKTMPRSSF